MQQQLPFWRASSACRLDVLGGGRAQRWPDSWTALSAGAEACLWCRPGPSADWPAEPSGALPVSCAWWSWQPSAPPLALGADWQQHFPEPGWLLRPSRAHLTQQAKCE